MKSTMLAKIVLSAIFATGLRAMASGEDEVHHPDPVDPVYLSPSLYGALKKQVPAFPEANSFGQKEDERILFELQHSRSLQQCAQAKSEVFVNLKNFYGQPNGPLTDLQVEKLNDFFNRLGNDANYYVQILKKDFPRPRPFSYLQDLVPCVPKEVTGAYPSGHATLSELFALVLGDIFPSKKTIFEKRANEIGMHRVLSGMHHPSDIKAGRELAKLLYTEFLKISKFRSDFKQLKKEVEAKTLN